MIPKKYIYTLFIVELLTAHYSIAREDMNTSKTSSWLTSIRELPASKKQGLFAATDKTSKSVTLEWTITNILSPNLAAFKKEVADLAAKTTAAYEIQFLHNHPEAASSEYFLKPCESFFKDGLEPVDWQQVDQTLQSTVKQ